MDTNADREGVNKEWSNAYSVCRSISWEVVWTVDKVRGRQIEREDNKWHSILNPSSVQSTN